MDCPFCQHHQTRTYNSRRTHSGKKVWRRRRCEICHKTFTTYEKIDLGWLKVKKRGGYDEPYRRFKLFGSLHRAAAGLPNVADTVDALTDTVEMQVLELQETEVTADQLAKTVLATLKRYNTGAFARYLTSQSNFSGIRDLQKELRKY